MDGEGVVPGAAGAGSETSAAAPASSAAPASPATPSTPATPAPATPATPAATPGETTASPLAGAPSKEPGEDNASYLARVREYEAKNPPKPAEKAPVAAPVDPAAPKPPEAKVEPPVADKSADKPAEAVADGLDPLDTTGPVSAASLAAALDAKPELEAMLKESGIESEKLFESLRLGAAGQQFAEVFPGGIEDGKFALQQAGVLAHADEVISALKRGDLKSTIAVFEEVLTPMSYILDEKDQPIYDEVKLADGTMQKVARTDGTISTFLDNVRDVAIDEGVWSIEQELLKPGAKDDPDIQEKVEIAQAAFDCVKQVLAGKYFKKADGSADMTEAQKAQQATLDAREKNIKDAEGKTAEQRRTESDQRFETFQNDIKAESNTAIEKRVSEWLDQTSLVVNPTDSQTEKDTKEFLRKGVLTEIRDGLFAKLSEGNLGKTFLARQGQLARRGPLPQTKAEIVNHYRKSIEGILDKTALPILAKAGYARVSQSRARLAKIASQEQGSRMEPRAAATSPALPTGGKIDHRAITDQARQEYRAKYGKEPSTMELLELSRQLETRAQQPRSA